MSSARYKKLLANLPAMAAVVNSFQSPEVQKAVYEALMDSLNQQDGLSESIIMRRSAAVAASEAAGDAHDLVEGDSIHSLAAEADD